jgi:hypothetical protein
MKVNEIREVAEKTFVIYLYSTACIRDATRLNVRTMILRYVQTLDIVTQTFTPHFSPGNVWTETTSSFFF